MVYMRFYLITLLDDPTLHLLSLFDVESSILYLVLPVSLLQVTAAFIHEAVLLNSTLLL